MKTITKLIYPAVAIACFALSPAPNAFGISPPPDGGYPGGNTAEGVVSPEQQTPSVDLLVEGFNNVNNLPGWFSRNNSEPLGFTNWFQGDPDRFEAFAGPANSYIAADLFNGSGFATISNWLLTPVLPLQDGVTFDFVTRTTSHLSASPDRLQVRLSRNGASTNVGSTAFDVGDFTELWLDINPFYSLFVYPDEWTPLGVTLSGFGPPTTGRFAFRYFVENGGPGGSNSWYIGIDNVIATGPAQIIVPRVDFNRDGFTDYVLFHPGTRQTAVWYLNNNVYIGGAYAPTLAAGWTVADVADFNGDGHPDYALFKASTRQTAIWYLNNNVYIGGAYGPTLPSGWELIATGDFNGDNKPDYVLYNASTRQTAIWYLNNNVRIGAVYGPSLPAGWRVVGVADFNRDGRSDYLLFNPTTRQSAIWYLNNNIYVSGAYGPTIASGYSLTGAADFNRDGKPDYALFNGSTLRTAIWYLNNNVYVSGAFGPTLPTGWSLAAP